MVVELPRDWQVRPVEECMAAIIDYRGKSPAKTTSGIPLITAKVVKGGRILNPDEFIAPQDFDQWMRRGLPHAGDVVMTTEAPLGEVAQLDGRRVALAQRLITLRGQPHLLDNTFLKFTLQSRYVQDQLRSRSTGTTVLGIRQSELRKVCLPLPPLDEQRAIAHVLGTLDDKIELNRRMNETLEGIARAIFKSWFVDFDPVRAKAEGRDPGLPEPIADLFPADLDGDGIPNGWTPAPLPELIDVNPRRTLRRNEPAPYLDMANMPTRGHMPDQLIDRPFGSGMRFINGDTLVARITPCLENGKTAWVTFLAEGQTAWGSTEFIVLRPKPPIPPVFAYCLARSEGFRQFAIQKMTGSSGRQRVPSESLSRFMLANPPQSVFTAFGRLVEPLFTRATVNAISSRTLAAIRDALLPKLLSGEIRINHTNEVF
ncbi:MAG: restriction endonuclease subunit S [Phycisphaerae bacterium]|nr:restriction endonuclease subunit S [Phycisphaerae bacterium]